jgi:hypothetical protein
VRQGVRQGVRQNKRSARQMKGAIQNERDRKQETVFVTYTR